MLGKASEIKFIFVVSRPEDEYNLAGKIEESLRIINVQNAEIVEVKHGLTFDSTNDDYIASALIIYKEANQHAQTT